MYIYIYIYICVIIYVIYIYIYIHTGSPPEAQLHPAHRLPAASRRPLEPGPAAALDALLGRAGLYL